MPVANFLQWLETRPFALAISASSWMFPTIETIHVVAITLVVGSIAMLDLRLIGLSRRQDGALELANEVLPWTWVCFGLAVLSGALMFSSAASRYFDNLPFRVKMLLLVLAGLNMAVFHLTAYRSIRAWNHKIPTPVGARVAGGVSLLFWISVVVLGRWIGFIDP